MSVDPQFVLQAILDSAPFARSDIHKRLLTYLVECYESDKTATETDIATDVFGRSSDFNSADDTIVRVSIYQLRKKLDAYYNRDGRRDAFQLTIPKGHYSIEFVKKSSQPRETVRRSKIVIFVAGVLITLLAFIVIWQFRQLNSVPVRTEFQSMIDTNSDIWGSYFDNTLPHDVVIGDFLIFEEYDPQIGRRRRIMDYFINTEVELHEYIKEYDIKDYNLLPIGEIPHHSIFNIKDISYLFFSYQRDYQIRMSTDFNLNETLQHNIIYLGDFKSLRILESFIENRNISFEYTDPFQGRLFISDSRGDTVKVFDNSSFDLTKESKYIDYCMILKTKGPNAESYLFIIGFGYISQLETVHILCDEKRIRDLENEVRDIHGHVPESFIMVLEVSGLYLTPYYTDVAYFEALSE